MCQVTHKRSLKYTHYEPTRCLELSRKDSNSQLLVPDTHTPSQTHTLIRLGHSVVIFLGNKVYQTTVLGFSTEIMHKLLDRFVLATPALPQAVPEQSVMALFFGFIPTMFLLLLAFSCQSFLPHLL